MPTVADLQPKAPKVLIYGPVGAGKTALALTLGARAQIIDLDDGLSTGRTLDDKWRPERLKVDVIQYIEAEPHKRATVFSKTKSKIFDIANQITAKTYPFDALIIDSLSALAESAVTQIMANSGRIGDPPEIQHWGLAFSEIKNVIAVLRSMPIVVILIAHEQVKTIGKGANQESKLEIAISGKNLPSQITRYFDEVLYIRPKAIGGGKFEYNLQTKGDDRVEARSRMNIPNHTNTNVGMWELLKMMGYTPPVRTK